MENYNILSLEKCSSELLDNNTNKIKLNYPNFYPELGNLTDKFRHEYIIENIDNNTFKENPFDNKKILSLVASNNINDPIYFWQLYSIIGSDSVHILIKKFYENIFSDNKEKWFRDEFIDLGSIEYHVKGQKNFWIDIMGGGKVYNGNYKKTHIKHKLVKNIMNKKGADRWLFHMKNALTEVKLHFVHDPRIIPCIDNFIKFFMAKYSVEFDFNLYDIIDINSKL